MWAAACSAEPCRLPLPRPPPRARSSFTQPLLVRRRRASSGHAELWRPERMLQRHVSPGPLPYPRMRVSHPRLKLVTPERTPPEGARGPRAAGAAGAIPHALSAVAAPVRYRPAAAGDLGTIQRMVLAEAMNPLSLDWRRFLVAEAESPRDDTQAPAGSGSWKIVGIGQLKRGRGIGGLIATKLLERAAEGNESLAPNQDGLPVYLLTIGKRVSFYERLGFIEVSEPSQVPPQLQLELQLGTVVARLVAQDRCLCMKLSRA